jgi:hypothetical protein
MIVWNFAWSLCAMKVEFEYSSRRISYKINNYIHTCFVFFYCYVRKVKNLVLFDSFLKKLRENLHPLSPAPKKNVTRSHPLRKKLCTRSAPLPLPILCGFWPP